MMASKDEILTLEELATFLKLSKSSLNKHLAQGKIPGQKIRRHWRFSKAVIDNWLKLSNRSNIQD